MLYQCYTCHTRGEETWLTEREAKRLVKILDSRISKDPELVDALNLVHCVGPKSCFLPNGAPVVCWDCMTRACRNLGIPGVPRPALRQVPKTRGGRPRYE